MHGLERIDTTTWTSALMRKMSGRARSSDMGQAQARSSSCAGRGSTSRSRWSGASLTKPWREASSRALPMLRRNPVHAACASGQRHAKRLPKGMKRSAGELAQIDTLFV